DGAYGIEVTAGAHTITVRNTGPDWLYCTYRLTNYLPADLRVLALANATSALVWVQNRDSTWSNRTPRPIPACRLVLGGFTPGEYEVEQWDTDAGKPLATVRLASQGGTLAITTPEGLV